MFVSSRTHSIGDDGSLANSEYKVGRRFTIDRGIERTIGAIDSYNITVTANLNQQ